MLKWWTFSNGRVQAAMNQENKNSSFVDVAQWLAVGEVTSLFTTPHLKRR